MAVAGSSLRGPHSGLVQEPAGVAALRSPLHCRGPQHLRARGDGHVLHAERNLRGGLSLWFGVWHGVASDGGGGGRPLWHGALGRELQFLRRLFVGVRLGRFRPFVAVVRLRPPRRRERVQEME